MLFQKIKIMLGGGSPEKPCGPYDTYLQDMQNSDNKSRPKIEDHKLVQFLVKMLRGDDPAKGPEKPVEEGIIDQVKRKMHE